MEGPRKPSEWLIGGGEMGELVRAFDWASTPLGPRGDWPRSLRTAVGMVLGSRVPMALLWGPELILIYNDACRELAGQKHPRALGRSTREVWNEVWHINEPIFARVLERGEATYLEDQLFPIERSGCREDAYFTLCYGPVRGEDGRVVGSLVTLMETTERFRERQERACAEAAALEEQRAIAAALERRERQFRVLIENLYSGVALVDASGKFTLYNARFLELFALDPDADINNVNSRDWSAWAVFAETGELLPVDDHPVRKAALTGEPVKNQLVGVRPPGATELTWMLVSASPLLGRDGNVEHLICTYHDITERKRAERALHEANERLLEADQRKNEFLAMLSHELRNPLSPIRNSVYVLEHSPSGGERAKRATRVIDRQAQHMTRLIDDLLDLTRISRGKITLQRTRVDLAALARGTAEDHRELYARNGIELVVEIGQDPLWVEGDPTRLAQVIGNLLNNAAKFTPRGGMTVLSVEPTGDEAVVRVRDTGAGMSRETLGHLFEPFVQGTQSLDRTHGGLGLGLALVKGLTEMHGGRVSAHSEGPGQGAELTVVLPLETRPRSEPAPAPSSGRRAGASRILVIEDNPDAADSLREALELGGHEVAVAYSGAEGVEAARRFEPEIVLCDIGLPGLDGYEVARALRAESAAGGRSIFLVALSGYALQEDVERSYAAGFDRHLAKPPNIDVLEKIVAQGEHEGGRDVEATPSVH